MSQQNTEILWWTDDEEFFSVLCSVCFVFLRFLRKDKYDTACYCVLATTASKLINF